MNQQEPGFRYTYSAEEQREIEAIRKKYEVPEEGEGTMETLRRLDASVTKKGTLVSLLVGILGSLILGTGMSLTMTEELSACLGVYTLPVGIGMGGLGVLMVSLSYPLYRAVIKRQRRKLAPTILKLTEELMR